LPVKTDIRAARSAGGVDEHIGSKLGFEDGRFVGSDEDGGFTANIAASGASIGTQRAAASDAINVVLWVTLVRLDASTDGSRDG
jgi:hypothetical protein